MFSIFSIRNVIFQGVILVSASHSSEDDIGATSTPTSGVRTRRFRAEAPEASTCITPMTLALLRPLNLRRQSPPKKALVFVVAFLNKGQGTLPS